MATYTAKIFFDERETNQKSGDDLEALYIWMLSQVHGEAAHYNGFIYDNETEEIVRKFNTSSME